RCSWPLAALECLREEGLAGTSAARIASRCDLSWGVIQYHFGDRSGLLLALLERGFESLERSLPVPDGDVREPADRLRALVEGMQKGMEHPDHGVLLDVQVELGRDRRHRAAVRKRAAEIRSRMTELWRKTLSDFPPDRVERAERLATLGLQGLSLERAVVGRRAAHATDVESLVAAVAATLGID
ncbi:MAG: helix-turn-helix domain-containing protein, partial [Myxococcota bacterium]